MTLQSWKHMLQGFSFISQLDHMALPEAVMFCMQANPITTLMMNCGFIVAVLHVTLWIKSDIKNHAIEKKIHLTKKIVLDDILAI